MLHNTSKREPGKVPNIMFPGYFLQFWYNVIGLVFLFLIAAWKFYVRFLPKFGIQSASLFYTALQFSIPAPNSRSAASKSASYGYDAFSFHNNFACCFRIHLSKLCLLVWCCWAQDTLKWHNFKPDLSFWCNLVHFNACIKLIFF